MNHDFRVEFGPGRLSPGPQRLQGSFQLPLSQRKA
jgi:hypothetical protein